jgi:hypothetical protein
MTPWALANTSACSRPLVMCKVQRMSPLVGRGRMNVCRAISIGAMTAASWDCAHSIAALSSFDRPMSKEPSC